MTLEALLPPLEGAGRSAKAGSCGSTIGSIWTESKHTIGTTCFREDVCEDAKEIGSS